MGDITMTKIIPRLGKKKTGKVSIKEGQFKIEVKERFRILGLFTAAISILLIVAMFLFPYVIAFLGLIWLTGTVLMSGLFDMINYARLKVWNGIKWVFRWCIKQPFLDYRYGRKKRKEMEDSRVYAT